MSLDWANERYVRMYTRDTDEWLVLPWQSRAVWPLLLRKVDRSGVLPAKLGARGVAVLIGLPLEVVDPGIAGLLEDGCLVKVDVGYVIPNFIEAQEASASDAKRQRDSRERRRAAAMGHPVTNRDDTSRPVTTGHEVSQPVTPCCAVPIRSEPFRDLSLGVARDPTVQVATPSPAHVPAPAPAPVPRDAGQLGELLEHAIRRLDAARAELDPSAKPIGSAFHVGAPGELLRARLRPLGSDARRAALDHCLDVLIARARASGQVGELRLGMLAGENSWPRWLAETPETYSSPRAPPATRSAKSGGRYEPPHPTTYQDGEIPL